MTSLQVQARALGDPTRHELFRYIADAGRPVDVAEMTAHIGLHNNAIRQHLAKLVHANLIVESKAEPSGRGRPRLRYVPNASADSRWGVVGPYERLTVLLTEIIRTGDSPSEVGRRAGRRHTGELSSGREAIDGQAVDEDAAKQPDPVAFLVERLADHGFDAVAEQRGDHVEIMMGDCPFESTAIADPDTICGVHLGIAVGAADSAGGLIVDELIPTDPRKGGCRLRCHLQH